ncbi:axoneme-associated protein mst101(1)-like [Penaeus vannamei]|uniref:axoneme-associated protein mst101(1)-like n=1 Tax=Penaeus vannamei TaxID=6689 RepID=UPI00387F9887
MKQLQSRAQLSLARDVDRENPGSHAHPFSEVAFPRGDERGGGSSLRAPRASEEKQGAGGAGRQRNAGRKTPSADLDGGGKEARKQEARKKLTRVPPRGSGRKNRGRNSKKAESERSGSARGSETKPSKDKGNMKRQRSGTAKKEKQEKEMKEKKNDKVFKENKNSDGRKRQGKRVKTMRKHPQDGGSGHAEGKKRTEKRVGATNKQNDKCVTKEKCTLAGGKCRTAEFVEKKPEKCTNQVERGCGKTCTCCLKSGNMKRQRSGTAKKEKQEKEMKEKKNDKVFKENKNSDGRKRQGKRVKTMRKHPQDGGSGHAEGKKRTEKRVGATNKQNDKCVTKEKCTLAGGKCRTAEFVEKKPEKCTNQVERGCGKTCTCCLKSAVRAKAKARRNGLSARSVRAACRVKPANSAREQRAAVAWNANTESGKESSAAAGRKAASAARGRKAEDEKHATGKQALNLRTNIAKSLLGFNPMPDRILKQTARETPEYQQNQCYAPTSTGSEEERGKLYYIRILIMTNQKWKGSLTRPDCNSDHQLLMADLRIRLKRLQKHHYVLNLPP